MDDSGFDVDCAANLRFGVAPALLANQRVAQLLKGKHHPREISALFVALEGFSIVLFRLAVPPRVSAEVAPVQLSVHQERSEEHTSELQSLRHLVCRLLLEKKE